MEETNPPVAVIIPVYRNPAGLRRCLDALGRQDYQGHYTITVVDNEQSFTLGAFQADYPDVTFLHEPEPGSYNARNKGIRETDAPILAFTDSDCIPHANWLTQGVRTLLSDDRIGLSGGPICVIPLDTSRKPTIAEYADIIYGFPHGKYFKCNFLPTANMLTKRSIMEQIGLFNGALKSSGDAEWASRAIKAGFEAIYDAEISVDHTVRNFRETTEKIRRLAGGWRDRNPSWRDCLRVFIWRPVIPLRRIKNIWKYQDPDCSVTDRILISLYVIYIRWFEYYCRLKLQIFKTASPR